MDNVKQLLPKLKLKEDYKDELNLKQKIYEEVEDLDLKQKIYEELKDFDQMNSIGKCLLYKLSDPENDVPGYRGCFDGFDNREDVKEKYDMTEQDSKTDHYDTITSWLEFAKAFLGFPLDETIDPMKKSFDEYCEKHPKDKDKYEGWTKEIIKEKYNEKEVNENEVDEAYKAFLKFSESVYSIGNVMPVGFSPAPTRLHDRWDYKIKWIYDVFFKKTEKDLYEKRFNKWTEFLAEIEGDCKTKWKKYIDKYFLQDFVFVDENYYKPIEPKEYTEKLVDWTDFFNDTSDRVQKREKRIMEYLENLKKIEDNK